MAFWFIICSFNLVSWKCDSYNKIHAAKTISSQPPKPSSWAKAVSAYDTLSLRGAVYQPQHSLVQKESSPVLRKFIFTFPCALEKSLLSSQTFPQVISNSSLQIGLQLILPALLAHWWLNDWLYRKPGATDILQRY